MKPYKVAVLACLNAIGRAMAGSPSNTQFQLLAPGWWWVDSVTSLAIIVLLVKEGREAWEGEEGEKED